jgi:hypothetical protein
MQRIQQSLEVAQTPREPSVTPRGGSASVRKVPRNPWLDRETSHERLVRESSAISNRDQPNTGTAAHITFTCLVNVEITEHLFDVCSTCREITVMGATQVRAQPAQLLLPTISTVRAAT